MTAEANGPEPIEPPDNGILDVPPQVRSGPGGWVAVTAMAAGLVLGILLTVSFGIGADIRSGEGFLVAQGSLAQTLTDDISGSGSVGPSFWSREGEFCRVFSARGAQRRGLSGIACRENRSWRIRMIVVMGAGGDLPTSVRSTMQDLMVGAPLSAEAERQARRQGWRAG
jgi:hypothetical protein